MFVIVYLITLRHTAIEWKSLTTLTSLTVGAERMFYKMEQHMIQNSSDSAQLADHIRQLAAAAAQSPICERRDVKLREFWPLRR